MNILIVGGLLILGIAAILGAVFLVISDQRKENTRLNNPKPDNGIHSSPPVTPTIPSVYKETVQPQQVTAAPVSRVRPKSTALTELEGVQRVPALNGQFHELADEIRSLHQQAWQLEQRLSVLIDMVDHVDHSQRSQDSHFHTEEDEDMEIPSENTIS